MSPRTSVKTLALEVSSRELHCNVTPSTGQGNPTTGVPSQRAEALPGLPAMAVMTLHSLVMQIKVRQKAFEVWWLPVPHFPPQASHRNGCDPLLKMLGLETHKDPEASNKLC